MLETVDLHITSASRNLKYLPLSFYRQLKLTLIQILFDTVLYKTRKTHSIILKPSRIFGETLRHQKQVENT